MPFRGGLHCKAQSGHLELFFGVSWPAFPLTFDNIKKRTLNELGKRREKVGLPGPPGPLRQYQEELKEGDLRHLKSSCPI